MTDAPESVPAMLPAYGPDVNLQRRKEIHEAQPKGPVTTDKPISFRVAKAKAQSTRTKPAKKRIRFRDPRNPKFY